MNKLLASAAMIALMIGTGPALADASGEAKLNYKMDTTCTVENGGDLNTEFDLSGSNILDAQHNVIPGRSLGSLLDGPLVTCSGAGAVLGARTQNGGMTKDGVSYTSGTAAIFYAATVKLGSPGDAHYRKVVVAADGTAGISANSLPTGAFSGAAVTGSAVTLPSPMPLIAGDYKDVLTVQVGDPL